MLSYHLILYNVLWPGLLINSASPRVLILDGNSEHVTHPWRKMGAQVRSNLCYLICLRHLIRSREEAHLIFSSKKTNYPACVRNMVWSTIWYKYTMHGPDIEIHAHSIIHKRIGGAVEEKHFVSMDLIQYIVFKSFESVSDHRLNVNPDSKINRIRLTKKYRITVLSCLSVIIDW